MIGKLKELRFNKDNTQDITITINENYEEEFDRLYGKDVAVEIKRYNPKRSLDMNSYCWLIIDRIAERTGKKKTEIYQDAIREIGGVSTMVCVKNEGVESLCKKWSDHGIGWITDTLPCKIAGCSIVRLYYGSSTYDSKQMSSLVDNLLQDADSLGIPIISAAERDKLLAQWGKKHD